MKNYKEEIKFMKRYIRTNSEINLSQCGFDFDLGDNYDQNYLETAISNIFDDFGCTVDAIDFRSVDYPRKKVYSQCGIDFSWKGEQYDSQGIEDALIELIEDEGGNFFGIEFWSFGD